MSALRALKWVQPTEMLWALWVLSIGYRQRCAIYCEIANRFA